jgi:Ni,Fe-hydrogenase maturation factor
VKTAIYGIGNILMGDDGIGPAVVRYLFSNYRACRLPASEPM